MDLSRSGGEPQVRNSFLQTNFNPTSAKAERTEDPACGFDFAQPFPRSHPHLKASSKVTEVVRTTG